jgi:4'-phosphopantetheinyl transferase
MASVPRLERGEVHVWKLGHEETATDLDCYICLLSSDEKGRASRFHFQHLAENFITDHGRLRLILGAYTQSCPETLVFAVNQFGKPQLAFPDCSLRFNLSHTTGLTLLAVCLDAELGIDVEAVRPIDDWREIARSHFSAQENDALHATTESDQQNAFFRCWTRKEALIKACGQGLSLPLDTFTVSLSPEQFPPLLWCAWDQQEVSRWALVSLGLGSEFVGALAIPNREWKIRQFDYSIGLIGVGIHEQ